MGSIQFSGVISIAAGTALTPVYLVLLSAVFVFRLVIHVYLRLTKAEFRGLLTPRDALFARKQDTACGIINVICMARLTTLTSSEGLRAETIRSFNNVRKHEKFDRLNYAVRKFLGLYFWERVVVRAEDQISIFETIDFRKFLNEVANKPIRNDRMWEVFVAKNPQDCRYPCIFRFHHCLADGHAIRDLFLHMGTNCDVLQQKLIEEFSWLGFFAEIKLRINSAFQTLMVLLRAPYASIAHCLNRGECNSFSPKSLSLNKQLGWKTTEYEKVKRIRKASNRHVTDILLCGISKSLSDMYQKRGEKVTHVTATFPTRISQVSHGLANEYDLAGIKVSVGSSRRDQDIITEYRRFKTRPLYLSNYLTPRVPFLLSPMKLPDCIHKATEHTFILSNIVGPTSKKGYNGMICDKIMFFLPNIPSNNALGISFTTYDGNATVSCILDSSVAQSENDAQALADGIVKYVDETYAALALQPLKHVQISLEPPTSAALHKL